MSNIKVRELYRVAISSTSYYDDIYLPEGKAETVYNGAVKRVHSSFTVLKYLPNGTLEKSASGTGTLRPR
jgi:hypothetical protein